MAPPASPMGARVVATVGDENGGFPLRKIYAVASALRSWWPVDLDVKAPGSGESHRMDWSNLHRLKPEDEVKFVIADRRDYEWSRQVVRERGLAGRAVLFTQWCPAKRSQRVHARLEQSVQEPFDLCQLLPKERRGQCTRQR